MSESKLEIKGDALVHTYVDRAGTLSTARLPLAELRVVLETREIELLTCELDEWMGKTGDARRDSKALRAKLDKATRATQCAVEAIDIIQRQLRNEPLGDLSVDAFLSALNGALNECRAALAATEKENTW